MINYDSVSIYQRLLHSIQQNPDWNVISNNSVVDALLRSNAEINAETARYAEYLFKESKWDTAQNMSSILAMANMLGYQPKRKISARGSILVSTDPKIQLIGTSMPYSALKEDNFLSYGTGDIVIGKNCTVTDNLGNKYLVASKKYDASSKSYTELEIIQGELKTVSLSLDSIRALATASKLDPYLYVPFKIKNCEAADNPLAKSFFKVFIEYNDSTGSRKEYRVVSSLLFSQKDDFDVEVYNDLYSQEIFYLKFNNDSTRGQVLDISRNSSIKNITIQYIETQGALGNVSTLFNTFVVKNAFVSASSQGTSNYVTLYGINASPISGGQDEESVSDIKQNAPKYYISNYTAGTKEAYEKTISNLELKVNLSVDSSIYSTNLTPTRVQVFGGMSLIDGVNQRVTKVSFLSPNLTDLLEKGQIAASSTPAGEKVANTAITAIEDALNFYLIKLKSPQDTLKFEPPTYVPFAVGFNCRVSKDSPIDLGELEQNIITYVDDLWGEASSKLDFNRSFYPSQLTADIITKNKDIISIETEVEAVKRLDWMQAERVVGMAQESQLSSNTLIQDINVMRIPFSFDNVFLGKKPIKGFKDFKTGSDYVARVDFLYKRPKSMASNTNYNTSWFIRDTPSRYVYNDDVENPSLRLLEDTEQESTLRSFMCRKVSDERYWDIRTLKRRNSATWNQIPVLGENLPLGTDGTRLVSSLLIPYQQELYTDNSFKSLAQDVENNVIRSLTPRVGNSGDLGACNMLFVCNTNLDTNNTDNKFVTGSLEIDFDSIYDVLKRFSYFDTELFNNLNTIDVAKLKCDQNEDTASLQKLFEDFCRVVANYVDIYVSFRPVDADLALGASSSTSAGRVLQIDSSDKENDLVYSNINLTFLKQNRMISVKCEYEE